MSCIGDEIISILATKGYNGAFNIETIGGRLKPVLDIWENPLELCEKLQKAGAKIAPVNPTLTGGLISLYVQDLELLLSVVDSITPCGEITSTAADNVLWDAEKGRVYIGGDVE